MRRRDGNGGRVEYADHHNVPHVSMSTPESELFPPDAGAGDSPRLKWMKKYNIVVHEIPDASIFPFVAHVAGNKAVVGIGASSEEACLDLIDVTTLPHWNQDAQP